MRCLVRHDNGTTMRVDEPAHLEEVAGRQDVRLWIDLTTPTEEEVRCVGKLLCLDDVALDDSLSGEQRPRIDEFDEYIFLMVYGVVAPGSDDVTPRKLSIFCGARFLVTIHEEPLRTIETLFSRYDRNPGTVLSAGVDVLLFRIIDGIVDNLYVEVDRYEERVEALEDASLEARVDDDILVESSGIRRALMPLRSLAASTRELLLPMARGDYDYVSKSLKSNLSHVEDHLMQVIEAIDSMREHLIAIRENYQSAVATQTNEVMKILTIMATVMLPPTLIAGIYGMNLKLWPSEEHPAGFLAVLIVMAAVSIGLVSYFRWRRWI